LAAGANRACAALWFNLVSLLSWSFFARKGLL
jgi:hypothetical protein